MDDELNRQIGRTRGQIQALEQGHGDVDLVMREYDRLVEMLDERLK